MRHGLVGAALAVSAVLAATTAVAAAPTVLLPGQTVSVPDFVDPVSLVAAKTVSFGGEAGPAGELTEIVTDQSSVNPFGFNDLVFAFALSMSHGDVAKVSLSGYDGYQTAVKSCTVAACIEGIGLPADTATRSADGDVVSFLFDTPITATSSGFVIYTDAKAFVDPPGAEIVDSDGNVAFALTFLPSAAPEPASWAMMLVGIAAVGGCLRWRSRAKLVEAPSVSPGFA